MVALVYLLTIASLIAVIGTRLRLRGGSSWLHLHTGFGVVGFVLWMAFLIAPESSTLGSAEVGIVGLGCWWVVSVVGLMLIQSSRRGRGRRVAHGRRGGGQVFAAIVHVGVFAAWVVCTYAYATKKV